VLSLFAFSSCAKESTSGDTAASIKTGATYSTVSIDQFSWITGSSSWVQPSKDRLESSQFKFKSNGTMTYQFDYDNSTTYTLSGEYYENSNGGYSFVADYSTNNGAGSGTQILVEGTIDPLSNGNFQVDMEYGSSANYSAIVNNQQFFSQSSKRFTTVMTIR
jgi:hypothetical protein